MLLAALYLAAQLAVPAPSGPLWVDLGPENRCGGLSIPSSGDGQNAADTVAGSTCRRIAGDGSLYLYVQADDARVPAGRYEAYLTVEYFDSGAGIVQVQYDKASEQPSIATKYTAAEGALLMLGSGKWQRAVVRLPDARFGSGQNFGSDLRLCASDLAVRRIEVAFSRPADYHPGGIDPEALAKLRTRIGPGMELTFGNDAGPAQAALFQSLGVTSVESYVTWQSVEDAGKDQWDWSRWDRQVAILKQAGLKWVPFLIVGPAYANPKWFRESEQSVPYQCLEHGQESKVQSLWNPHLRPWVERFLKAFADRYRDQGVIESVLLGVTGIYGESIYPAGPEGGWTADVTGRYHNHAGWWAGDRYAVADLRRWLQKRYGSVEALNKAWQSSYRSFERVEPFLPAKASSLRARADFVRWYTETMTGWAAWWVGTTRRQFPKTEIYLCTGGDAHPVLGADFSAQAKAIQPFGAGIRITNEASDYVANFTVTREVATACRAFGTFFGYEPAGRVDADGVTARIYNATASGALQLHYYTPNVTSGSAAMRNFQKHAGFLQRRSPRISAGIYLPKTSWAINPDGRIATYATARALRDCVDIEFVDRATIGKPALRGMRVLALADGPYAEAEEAAAIRQWVSGGGILVARADAKHPLLSTPDGATPDGLLASPPRGLKLFRMLVAGAPPRRFRLEVGQGNDGTYLFGDWFGQERGLEWSNAPDARKRWSGAHPGFYLPVDPSSPAILTLDAYLAGHSLPGPNRVLVNGTPVGILDQAGCHAYRFTVPQQALAGRPIAEVTLEVQTWKPSEHGSGDTRSLGAAVRSVEICAAGAEAEAPGAATLRTTMDVELLIRHCVRRIGKGATVTLPADTNDRDLAACVVEVVQHPERILPGTKGITLPAPEAVGVFTTRFADGTLFYNSAPEAARIEGIEVPGKGIAWR